MTLSTIEWMALRVMMGEALMALIDDPSIDTTRHDFLPASRNRLYADDCHVLVPLDLFLLLSLCRDHDSLYYFRDLLFCANRGKNFVAVVCGVVRDFSLDSDSPY